MADIPIHYDPKALFFRITSFDGKVDGVKFTGGADVGSTLVVYIDSEAYYVHAKDVILAAFQMRKERLEKEQAAEPKEPTSA